MKENEENRARQLSIAREYQKGVKLIDIDTTIADYMVDTVIPDVEEHGETVKVPLLYGNAERWASARKEGYLRDQRGRIQLPLVMFKRNSIERDSSLAQFKDLNTLPAYKRYSPKNRYERFSLQTNARPVYEEYRISVPDYVTVSYEVMIWTSFTEHMNKIVEAFQYATDRYWGTDDKYKFRTRIDSFDNQQEVGAGSERIIRTSFTMAVNAYLLPETYDDKATVRKSFTTKRVVFGVETDLTGNLFTSPNLYNEYQNVIDFVAIRGSQEATYVDGSTVELENVSQPSLPPELVGSFDTKNWYQVYVNGQFVNSALYDYTYNGTLNTVTFNFTSSLISSGDEVVITGKFIEL